MVEKLEGTGRVYDSLADDDASSGIRSNPWIAHLRALERRNLGELDPGAGGLVDGLVAQVGARVLERFDRLSRDDHRAVLKGAIDRLACAASLPMGPVHDGGSAPRTASPAVRPLRVAPAPVGLSASEVEARIAHAVFCAAIPLDLRRWVEEIDADPAEISRELTRACQRAAALAGRERSVFFAVCALDDVAVVDEVGKVVLRAAVAYQMRWNTAHQNVSRAWRKICEGGALGSWCRDWRAGHRFVCGPPSLELWGAGRAYMDAYSGHDGAHPGGRPGAPSDERGEGFDAWVEAHEAHNAWFNEWKKQSGRAVRRWRDLATALDGSGVKPGAVHAPLVQGCAALGIDRWVIPGKLRQQSWREVLDAAHRPAPATRGAWIAFLRDHGFGPEPEAAFRELERTTALADVASVELEDAYRRLLAAAERHSGASLLARDTFRGLVDGMDAAHPGGRPGAPSNAGEDAR